MGKPKFSRPPTESTVNPRLEAQRRQLLAMKLTGHNYGRNRKRARMICQLASSYDPVRAALRNRGR